MSTPQGSLLLFAHAPALLVDDDRPLAIVHGLERALPGLKLGWRVSEEGRPVALPQRDAWLTEASARKKFPLLCNGDERYPVTVAGLERPARLSPGGQPQLEVHVRLPLDEAVIAAVMPLLEWAAEGARSFWGHASPNLVAREIARQTRHSAQGPERSPRGLPMLKLPEALSSPEIPELIGWTNYWSAAAARSLGFPDPTCDAELLSRARRTGTGGWVVRLTDSPLELDNPVHLDALLRAYERFPEIGGRVPPR